MSVHPKIARIGAAVVAGAAIFLALTVAMRLKDAPASPARSAPAPDTGTQLAAGPAASRRHEIKALEAELEKKPNHVPILFRLAQLAREDGKPAEGLPHLRRILELEPANVEARLELGRSLYDTGDVAGALTETNRILAKDPKNVDALYNMGAIYGNSNKLEAARDYWTRAVASDPQSDSGKRAREGLERLAALK